MLAWPYIVSVATADTEYTLPRSTTPTVDTLGVATEAGQTERDTTLSVPDSFHKHFRCGSVQAVMTEAPAASRASRQVSTLFLPTLTRGTCILLDPSSAT